VKRFVKPWIESSGDVRINRVSYLHSVGTYV
jgi:hypothetical protein